MKNVYLKKIKAGLYEFGDYQIEHHKKLRTWFIIKNKIIMGSRSYLKDAVEWCRDNA